MKRVMVTVLAAVCALTVVTATGASARTTGMGALTTTYAGVYQGSAEAYNYWNGNSLAITVKYVDGRTNPYPVYAKATFYQQTRTCNWLRRCSWTWKSLGEQRAPNVNTSSRWQGNLAGNQITFSRATSGGVGTFAASYAVCTDIPFNTPFRPDPCSGSGRYQYRR